MSRQTGIVLALLVVSSITRLAAQSDATVSLRDRLVTASKIYHQITTFFPDLSRQQFDRDYADYLASIVGASDDRRAFDLASMSFIATLHDGHSAFDDPWLDQTFGQATGLTVYSWDGQWVVVSSELASVRVGDVVEAIDSVSTQQYFERNRKYISASSERDAATNLFATPVLFPERFALTLDGSRHVAIDRSRATRQPRADTTEGRWLVPDSVAYVKVPSFRSIEPQAAALRYFRQFLAARTVILDIRGNSGGEGDALQRGLMGRPYPLWTSSSAVRSGFLLREYDVAYPEVAHLTSREATVRAQRAAFGGKLIVLIDRGCASACEDFVMPFKVTGRALLVGEATAGTFSFTNATSFDNGMRLIVASVRNTFPDGGPFEGVGITPDVEVHPSVQDLKAGRDVVLDRAVELARRD